MSRIVAILRTMFLLCLGANEFLCGNPSKKDVGCGCSVEAKIIGHRLWLRFATSQ